MPLRSLSRYILLTRRQATDYYVRFGRSFAPSSGNLCGRTSLADADAAKQSCSQLQYRISARVEELMHQHHGPAAARVIKELYHVCSRYLHAGRLLSSRSYGRNTIWQPDSSSKNDIRLPVPLAPLLHLREYTSSCIRTVTYGLASPNKN